MGADEVVRAADGASYRFDDVSLDVQNLQLTVHGEIRPLEPKSFRLLEFLIKNRGRVVPKEEILAAVWPDTFVTDNALTRAVGQIRKALDDDAKEPRYIETVPTIGYRFIGGAPQVPGKRRRGLYVAAGIAAAASVGLLLWIARPASKTPAPTFLNTQQLTNGAGLEVNASFSPDGRLVTYASDRGGSFEIYVRSLQAGSRDLPLTSNGNENLFPRFSQDGQWVAFSSSKTPGIYKVPSLGGPVRKLTEFGVMPVWSPDGRQIVFLSHPRASLSTTDYYYYSDSTLWLVSADGGEPHQITFPDKPEGGQTFPSWSPDGKEIRFVNHSPRKVSIYSYRVSDGTLTRRFGFDEHRTLGSATFTPDDRWMFYVSASLNGDIGIWAVNLNPRTLSPLSEPQPVFRNSLGVPRDLSLSPDGKHILYSAVLANSQMLVQPLKNGRADGEPFPLTHDSGYRNTMAKWFPDSRALVYTKFSMGQPAQVWQAKLDGSSASPVSATTHPQYFGHVLDGGQSVAFAGIVGPGRVLFQMVSLADGSVRTLGETAHADQVSFAPDGSEVIFHDSNEDVLHLWRFHFQTGRRTQLTFGPVPEAYGHYSPDGKWISFQVMPPGRAEIAVMPSSRGALEKIWSQPGLWFSAGWSWDGEKLFVAGSRGSGWAIYSLSRRTRSMERLTRELPVRMYVRYPEQSPDGKYLSYEFNESKGNVFLAELP